MPTLEIDRHTELLNHQEHVLPPDERVLTEVAHLIEHRRPDGSYDDHILRDMLTNYKTAVKEAAMPYAVATPSHDVETDPMTGRRVFRWLGQTAVESAMSGYRYHKHENARRRVDVEVQEAVHAQETLRPGRMQVFISPKMSGADAPLAVAREEHLGDEDSLRVRWLETDAFGEVTKHKMQSILVKDVPLEAWVSLLADKDSILGKSIEVDDPESALSIMKTFEELEVEMGQLPEGVVSLVEAVIPHIDDEVAQGSVEHQLALFRGDQQFMRLEAEKIALRWMKFDGDLAESLLMERANREIEQFIEQLDGLWNDDSDQIIEDHRVEGGYRMTRELAKILEKAKQNTLWTTAGVLTGNEEVISQITPENVDIIKNSARWSDANPHQAHVIESQNLRMIAGANVSVGGGCNGTNEGNFKLAQQNANQEDSNETENSTVLKCVNCPECKTFHEEVKKEAGKNVCDNPDCKLAGKSAKAKAKSED